MTLSLAISETAVRVKITAQFHKLNAKIKFQKTFTNFHWKKPFSINNNNCRQIQFLYYTKTKMVKLTFKKPTQKTLWDMI